MVQKYMEKDFRDILSTLSSFNENSDCEMFNMGDWDILQLREALLKREAVRELIEDESKSLEGLSDSDVYEIAQTFILWVRTLCGDRNGLRDIEFALAIAKRRDKV